MDKVKNSPACDEAEEQKFVIRVYSKSELAQMYFPDAKPKSALVSLWRWIRRCSELDQAIMTGHAYSKYRNNFLSYEVELIVRFLGEP